MSEQRCAMSKKRSAVVPRLARCVLKLVTRAPATCKYHRPPPGPLRVPVSRLPRRPLRRRPLVRQVDLNAAALEAKRRTKTTPPNEHTTTNRSERKYLVGGQRASVKEGVASEGGRGAKGEGKGKGDTKRRHE